ncbi:putative undecaprenyl-phosphate N-acetylgalactosaminyl 1-phosphate transferase [mine drainage metagenome]|uniref:Putative undecaprenyl-phosphate N-acetylgalactosaminyl 1-phosphate transferase n=1 Tax=mine drainage metagenome TaxID=410659 RepID=A0A1J5SZI7_9ZZZZ
MKRIFDFILSLIGLIISSPVLIPVIFLVWINDWHSPFYIAQRVGKGEKPFKMIKLRSMIINADKSGVDSTSSNDKRITVVGRFIRSYKLDELSQLWNVLIGDMSLVGPRPNVKRETDLYTSEEKKLLSVKPGITDFSSIVFSDEGEILKNQSDPDISYNQLIRPGKSMLGIFYIENRNLVIDMKLIYLTVVAIISKQKALNSLSLILKKLNASDLLIEIAKREKPLTPMPPPGATKIVTNREGRIEY